MENPERRAALDQARKQALYWAEQATEAARLHVAGDEHTAERIALASMWANVAQAMKVGNERADNP